MSITGRDSPPSTQRAQRKTQEKVLSAFSATSAVNAFRFSSEAHEKRRDLIARLNTKSRHSYCLSQQRIHRRARADRRERIRKVLSAFSANSAVNALGVCRKTHGTRRDLIARLNTKKSAFLLSITAKDSPPSTRRSQRKRTRKRSPRVLGELCGKRFRCLSEGSLDSPR